MTRPRSADASHRCLSRRGFGTAVGGLLTSSLISGIAASAAERRAPPVRDLWPAFWHLYSDGTAWSLDRRAGKLMSSFFAPNAAIYAAAEVKHLSQDAVADWLTRFDPIAGYVRNLHGRFATDYATFADRFLRFLPDYDGSRSPITLLPSLGRFDAHLAPNGAELPLYFGLDGIVAFHGRRPDLSVLLSHETFHCYQGQRNPSVMLQDKLPVYAGLWIEGGATWVSERLNPGASSLSILLDDRALLAIQPPALLTAMRGISASFDSLADADAASFFTMDYKGGWPARVGYLVGLLIARRVGPAMSIGRFASLPLDEMRSLYRRTLDELIDRANLTSSEQ